ncbi:MAG: hypothetical protein H8K08_00955 [Nitrospira sp.]|nr:hypothetical protein [Nitrospira sp.]
MKKIFFSGIIHPERLGLTIGTIEQDLGSDGKIHGSMKVSISNGQLAAFIEWDNESEDVFTLRNIVQAAIEPVVNIASFLKGYAFNVEIVRVFNEGLNESLVFNNEIPALVERNQKRELTEVQFIYPLCCGPDGLYFRRCLNDLNLAIKHPDDTGFYCYRALESLKQSFGAVSGEKDDRKQWKAMADALGGKEEDTKLIRDYAFPARHGVPSPITDEERRKIFLCTWNIVERFIDYRLKDSGSSYRLQT